MKPSFFFGLVVSLTLAGCNDQTTPQPAPDANSQLTNENNSGAASGDPWFDFFNLSDEEKQSLEKEIEDFAHTWLALYVDKTEVNSATYSDLPSLVLNGEPKSLGFAKAESSFLLVNDISGVTRYEFNDGLLDEVDMLRFETLNYLQPYDLVLIKSIAYEGSTLIMHSRRTKMDQDILESQLFQLDDTHILGVQARGEMVESYLVLYEVTVEGLKTVVKKPLSQLLSGAKLYNRVLSVKTFADKDFQSAY